jgi:hypothetical protein
MLQLVIVNIMMDLIMKKIIPLVLSSVVLTGCMTAHGFTHETNPIHFPKDLFAEQIKGNQCVAKKHQRVGDIDVNDIAKINANKLFANDNSLSVSHDELSYKWAELLRLTYQAEATSNKSLAKDVVNSLVYIAKAEALLSTTHRGDGECWKNGNKNAKCIHHTPQHTSFTFNAMMFSAIILKEHMSDSEIKILNKYFKKAYNDFVSPLANQSLHNNGFYEWGDGGIGVLAYAHWTNNHKLAYREIKQRRSKMLKVITKEGYIDNNSYRGNRGYWYHTLGANSMYGYALLAKSYGVDLFRDEYLGPYFKQLALKVLEGDIDIKSFDNIGFRGKNVSRDPKDARRHMHQLAVSLPTIMESEFGMAVNPRYSYTRKVKWESIDRFIGFNASCYYSSNN